MRTRAWHRSVGGLLAFPVLSLALYVSPLSLLVSLAIYLAISISVTCGYHRLFAHNAYSTARDWHWVFGVVGCIALNSSPAQWSMVHSAHHKHADTARDPHATNWLYFFRFKDRIDVPPGRSGLRLLRDPMHQFFVNHSFSLSSGYALLTLVLGGVWGLLFLYAVPVCVFLFISGIHTVYAHSPRGSLDRPWLEFLLPLCGEWIHKQHHTSPYVTPFPGGMDLGGYFIEMIRTDGIRSTDRTVG
jgi:fatty-acid desaturase